MAGDDINDVSQTLHEACQKGNVGTVIMLLSTGVDATTVNKHGQTPLHSAAAREKECPELCEILLKHSANIDAANANGDQPLHLASLKGHLKTVKLLLSHGAHTNAVNKQGQTPLHKASNGEKDSPELCQLLLKHDAKIDAVDEKERQPLHLASRKGYAESGKLLVSHKADTNAVDKQGQTPLHLTASGEKDCPKLCEILLEHDAKIDAEDINGNQPLHYASGSGHAEAGKLLLSHGADTNAINIGGVTPLHTVANGDKDCPELCDTLLQHDAKVDAEDKDSRQPLHWAAYRGHGGTGKLLLSHGANANAVTKHGQTPLHVAATGVKKDSPELCEILLKYDSKLDAEDEHGNQPLHWASFGGHTGTGRLLVTHGADTNAVNKLGQTPLHRLGDGEVDCPELCEILLKHSAKVDAVDDNGNQPLHLASLRGHIRTGNLLVSYGAETNVVNKYGLTLLHAAATGEKDCPELCELLLKHSAKIDAVDDNGNQPLHLASLRGHIRTGNLLVSYGAETNVVNKYGLTLLHAAATGEKDSPELCEILLKHGARIDAVGAEGNQPLHLAGWKGHAETCKLLVSHGADTNAVNKLGQTPLHRLGDGEVDCPELCEILLKHSAKVDAVDDNGNQPLHLASLRGHIRTGNLLVSYGAETNVVNKYGLTLLHAAATGEKDCPELCELLLKHSAKIDAVDDNGNQPLHLASLRGHIRTGNLLVSYGAETNVVNKYGLTLLHAAATGEKDSPELCEILLKHGARIDAVGAEGNQPLHLAGWKGHAETCKLLVSHGADTNAVNKLGQTPLHRLGDGEVDCPELCEILLKHSAKVDAVDDNGNQPLHLASLRGHIRTGNLLVSYGAETNVVNKYGLTLLHAAATGEKDCPELCELLLKHSAKIDAVDDNGNQPLHLASLRGHIRTGNLLVSYGAETNVVNKYGLTLLHAAATGEKDSPELCEILLKHGARIDAVGAEGNQPLHLAGWKGHAETCKLLVSHGADTNAVNKQGQTSLHAAATGEKDSPELCEILLKHGARIDAVDAEGNQPLHLAGWKGHLETGKVLVSHGADSNALDKQGRTLLHEAAAGKEDSPQLCEMLLKHDATTDAVDANGNQPLHLASFQGHLETGKLLLSHGTYSNALNKQGRTPLHEAAAGKDDSPQLCEILLKHDVTIDAVDANGNQPLHLASFQGHLETGKLLLSHGTYSNALNKQGRTPLHEAAAGKDDSPQLCEMLLKHDVTIDAVDAKENQPLHLASLKGHLETGKVLVSRGADTNAVNKGGHAPLHVAAAGEKDCPELCEMLLKHYATIDAVDAEGNQALHWAGCKGHLKTGKVLVSHGADSNALNKQGRTPLHEVAAGKEDSPRLCEMLLKHDARIDAVDAKENQPLHLASLKGHLETGKVLVSRGADTNAVNKRRYTPLHEAAIGEKDCPQLCEILLKHNAKIDAVDEGGIQPLHLASRMSHVEIGKVLLSHGADTNAMTKIEQTALHAAASGKIDCPELCEVLLKHNAKIDAVDEGDAQPLHLAGFMGNVETGKLLLSRGADANAVTKFRQTPLHSATTGGKDCPDMCEALLTHYAKIDAADSNGCRPLHLAASKGKAQTIKLLVYHGADTNAVDKHGYTPLYAVVTGQKDSPELCEILLNHRAAVDATDEYGRQPLHWATYRGHQGTGKLLLSHGADINAVTKQGETPLHAAAEGDKDCPDLCEILLKQNAKIDEVDENGAQPLHMASRKGHVETAKLLLSRGAYTNTMNKRGQTTLHAAVSGEKDCPELCQILLKHGANIDAVDENGCQPLHLASFNGHLTTGRLLMAHGADTNTVTKRGQTPLHHTAMGKKDCPELCEILLKTNAKVDAMDKNRNQPLHLASLKGHVGTSKVLVSCGTDTNVVNQHGQTPLHLAAVGERDCPELCEFLVKHNAKFDVMDENGNQPLHLANWKGHAAISKLLVSHGADTNALNKHGYTPLHTTAAGEKDCSKLCEILLKHDAKIDVENRDGVRPLHLAAIKGNIDIGKLLISYGADTNAVMKCGLTPLHVAALGLKSCPDMAELLLKHNAKIDAVNNGGDQPLHFASFMGHIDIGKLLISYGADTNALSKNGYTPLHAAGKGEKDCPNMCEILLKHGAKIDAVDEDGNQPLHIASIQGHTETCKLLASRGADANAVNKRGQIPALVAALGAKHFPAQFRIDFKLTYLFDIGSTRSLELGKTDLKWRQLQTKEPGLAGF